MTARPAALDALRMGPSARCVPARRFCNSIGGSPPQGGLAVRAGSCKGVSRAPSLRTAHGGISTASSRYASSLLAIDPVHGCHPRSSARASTGIADWNRVGVGEADCCRLADLLTRSPEVRGPQLVRVRAAAGSRRCFTITRSSWGPDDQLGRLELDHPGVDGRTDDVARRAGYVYLSVEYFKGIPSCIAVGDPVYDISIGHSPDTSVRSGTAGTRVVGLR